MNSTPMNNTWGLNFDNNLFWLITYIPMIILTAYFAIKMINFVWSLFTPGHQWPEICYILLAILCFSYLVYIGNCILNAMEKTIHKIQKERKELSEKIAYLEEENSELRAIFKRAFQISENDKKYFQ